MNRLTKSYPNGFVTLDASQFPPIDQAVLDSEIRNSEPIRAAVERLAEYEDAEKKGLLLRLPCKVGDTVYVNADGVTFEGELIHFKIGANGIKSLKLKQSNGSTFCVVSPIFGVNTFLTPEAAQQALKARGNNGN